MKSLSAPATAPRALLFHDSFLLTPEERRDGNPAHPWSHPPSACRLVSLLGERFPEAAFTWQYAFDPDLVTREHVDVVIEEEVERMLIRAVRTFAATWRVSAQVVRSAARGAIVPRVATGWLPAVLGATFEDGGRRMRDGRPSFDATAFLAIAWMVSGAACGGAASPEAFSRPPPFLYDAGGRTPATQVDASGAPMDASIDMRVPPAPAVGPPAPTAPAQDAGALPPVVRDAGISPAVTPPPPGKPATPPAAVARDAAVDAPELGTVKVDAATKVPPVDAADPVSSAAASSAGAPAHVFVIAMENQSAASIYGSADAPYINKTLLPISASASAFADELPALPSEPHYIWMEAGTNSFSDHTFTTDDSPSAANSTASTQHLVSQIRAAGRGLDWMAYQEGMTGGECPVVGIGVYVPRHDPTLFFRDVSGDPPSGSNAYCASHHRPLSALAGDLASGQVASYVFITPNLCHDMHGSLSCPSTADIRAGDDWLSSAMPPLMAYVGAHGGVIFITWDEGSPLPFIAAGPHVKAGYRSTVAFHHGSLLKTVEEILRLPILPTVQHVSDLSDLFKGSPLP